MTKKILLVVATELEVKPLLQKITFKKQFKKQLKEYYYNNIAIDVLVTSVGMVATTFMLTGVLSEKKYDLLINAGICGAFQKALSLGDVVNVTEDFFPEIGIEKANHIAPLKIKGNKNEVLESVNNDNFISLSALHKLKQVKGITVNTITGTKKRLDFFKNNFHPDIESMEGAAFLYVCNAFNQSCVQIRSISNYVGHLDKKDWAIDLAVENLNGVIEEILNEYLF